MPAVTFKAVDNHKQATTRLARYHYAVGTGIPEHLYGEVQRRLDAADSVLQWGSEHGHQRVASKGVPKNIQTRKLQRGVLVDLTLSMGKLWRVAIRCPGYHHEPAKDLTVVLQWDIERWSCKLPPEVCNEGHQPDDPSPTLVTAWFNNPSDWHRLTSADSQQYKD